MPTSQVKPFDIPKLMVWEAYRKVAANKGAPGVDEVTLGEFEADLKNNLFKIWNRMSSGAYFPPPVRAVEIPKPHGGGYQNARCAHGRRPGCPDGGGHGPGGTGGTEVPPRLLWLPSEKGDLGGGGGMPAAVLEVRLGDRSWTSRSSSTRCRGTSSSKRWRRSAPPRGCCCTSSGGCRRRCSSPDGTLIERDKGTPQGSAASPILANLFMHFAFDNWMAGRFPDCPFERFADDAVVHCREPDARPKRCLRGSPGGWKR